MCHIQHGFKFCTCLPTATDPAVPAPKDPAYTWYLTRFRGIDEDGPVGSIVGPSADLGEGLTLEKILEVLNSGEGFDFEYSPEEKDCLRISRTEKAAGYQYMSLLYTDGKWEEGMNPPFTTRTEELAHGKIKRSDATFLTLLLIGTMLLAACSGAQKKTGILLTPAITRCFDLDR